MAKILGWLRRERDLAPASLARHLSTLRMFSRFLVQEGVLARDRIGLARSPKLWQELPDALSAEQARSLLEHVPDGPWRLRDRCALELLYATGGRASEIGRASCRERV